MPGSAYSQLYSQPEWMNVCTYSMYISTYIINVFDWVLHCTSIFVWVCMNVYIYYVCMYVCKHVCMCGNLPLRSDWVLHMGCDASRHIVRRLQQACDETHTSTYIHTVHIYIQCYRSCMYVCMFIYSMWGFMYLCTYLRIYVYFRIEYLRCIINVSMFIWPVWDVFPNLKVMALRCLRWRELWKSATGLCSPSVSCRSIRWLCCPQWFHLHTHKHTHMRL